MTTIKGMLYLIKLRRLGYVWKGSSGGGVSHTWKLFAPCSLMQKYTKYDPCDKKVRKEMLCTGWLLTCEGQEGKKCGGLIPFATDQDEILLQEIKNAIGYREED